MREYDAFLLPNRYNNLKFERRKKINIIDVNYILNFFLAEARGWQSVGKDLFKIQSLSVHCMGPRGSNGLSLALGRMDADAGHWKQQGDLKFDFMLHLVTIYLVTWLYDIKTYTQP